MRSCILSMEFDKNLPVAVDNLPEDIDVKGIKNIAEVKDKLHEFKTLSQYLEKSIAVSKQKCEEAKESVQDAKNYDDAWYKIGSGRKKTRLIAEAQEDLSDAVSVLQQGQALTFQYQKRLAEFCVICLQLVKNNTSQIDELSGLLVKFVEEAKKEPVPQYVLDSIDTLYTQVEERKAEIAKSNQNKKYIIAGIVVALILIAYLFFTSVNG